MSTTLSSPTELGEAFRAGSSPPHCGGHQGACSKRPEYAVEGWLPEIRPPAPDSLLRATYATLEHACARHLGALVGRATDRGWAKVRRLP